MLEVAHAMLAAKSFCQPFVVRVGYQGVGDYIMNPFEECTRMSLDSLHFFLQMKSGNFWVVDRKLSCQYGFTSLFNWAKVKFVLPVEDCVLLPIVHTTAEELAQYIATEVERHLGSHLRSRSCQWLEVKVSERPGQGGNWAMDELWISYHWFIVCSCLASRAGDFAFGSVFEEGLFEELARNPIRLYLPPPKFCTLTFKSFKVQFVWWAWSVKWNPTKVASFYLWLVGKFVDLQVLQSPAWCQCPASIL